MCSSPSSERINFYIIAFYINCKHAVKEFLQVLFNSILPIKILPLKYCRNIT